MHFINKIGLYEITLFLQCNHKSFHTFNEQNIRSWCAMAENESRTIEIKGKDSISGHTVEYVISDDGYDSYEVE